MPPTANKNSGADFHKHTGAPAGAAGVISGGLTLTDFRRKKFRS
jgi:hypothetical protein